MIPSQRALFDIPADVAYFNCAYMSPLPRASVAAGQAAVARKATPWAIRPADFFPEADRARALFARLINADAEGVALVPAASYGIATAAANLPLRPGQTVVLPADQFPSNVYPWRARAAEAGARIVTATPGPEGDLTAALLDAIDRSTAIVACAQCRWTDGALVDLVRVGAAARAQGAALVLDLTQSAGAAPFDATTVRPDVVTAACYKWLLGPYTTGFLWMAPHLRTGRPLEHHWLGRAGSEDFSGLTAYRDDFQPGARRFDMGEFPNFALLPMVAAGLGQLLDWSARGPSGSQAPIPPCAPAISSACAFPEAHRPASPNASPRPGSTSVCAATRFGSPRISITTPPTKTG